MPAEGENSREDALLVIPVPVGINASGLLITVLCENEKGLWLQTALTYKNSLSDAITPETEWGNPAPTNLNDAILAARWTQHGTVTTPRIASGPYSGIFAAGIGTNQVKYRRAAACAICFAHELQLPEAERQSPYATGPLFNAISHRCRQIVSGTHAPSRSLKVILSDDFNPDVSACIYDVVHEAIQEIYDDGNPDWNS